MYQLDKYLRGIPRPVVRGLRDAYLRVLDLADRLRGRADADTPPRSLHFIGGGDFAAIGRTFLRHFVEVGGLRPSDAVLDIGCGTGRMAIPLLGFLDSAGSYAGFDISEKAIAWCRRAIGARNPRFVFHHADIRNPEYNPRGALSASAYRFPCAEASIDFAFATSVFTHMRRDETAHYLAELRRALKPAGRAMLTFFLIDAESERRIRNGGATLDFSYRLGDCLTIDPRTPERAIAYPVEVVDAMLREAGLRLQRPVLYGSWSGRETMLDSQDTLVVAPAPAAA